MTDTSVKFFHSGMAGAPTLNGTAGSLVSVLTACLVNGFAVSAVASLVVADEIATVTMAGSHPAEVGSVVAVSGASPGGLNGEKRVISTGSGATQLTFAAPGIGNQTATGAISLKIASAGWSIFASSVTTEAAYKSVALESTGCYLKVLDTAAKYARVRGYETMSSLTVGAGPFPTDTQKSGGAYWIKSNVADSAARPWVLVADDRSLYLLTRWHSSYPAYGGLHFFGDLVPVKPGDAWACAVSGNAADTSASSPGILDDYPHMSLLPSQLYLARPHTGIGSSVAARKGFSVPLFDNAQMTFASGAGPMRYPNGPDQGLYLSEHFVFEALEASLRGVSPGLYCSPQSMPDGWAEPHYSISSVALLPGRLVKVEPYGGNGSPLTGYAFFDVTGPWR